MPRAERRQAAGADPADRPSEEDLDEALRHHSAGNTPGFLLRHAALRWQRHVTAALADMSMTHVKFLVLGSTWWLGRGGEAPRQRDVAEHAGLDAVMTSQVLKLLERDGHVRRVRDTDDARAVRVIATTQGRDLARRCVAIMGRMEAFYFADALATPEFMATLRALAGRDFAGNATQA